MKTLIIDNYDSFTYNLYQCIAALGGNPRVFKNDGITAAAAASLKFSHIVISPGPGTVLNKEDFGACKQIILELGPKVPLLGVCLGHQGIARAFGARIGRAPKIIHGKQSQVEHDGSGIFRKIPNPFKAMRYHSLCVLAEGFPSCLAVTARAAKEKTIMGLRHGVHPVFGIQFHPESFGTPEGTQILKNFLNFTHDKENPIQHRNI